MTTPAPEPLGPIRITEGAWYRLTYEDRLKITGVLEGVGVGELYGRIEDAIRGSLLSTRTQNTLLERLAAAVCADRATVPVPYEPSGWQERPLASEAGPVPAATTWGRVPGEQPELPLLPDDDALIPGQRVEQPELPLEEGREPVGSEPMGDEPDFPF